MTDAGTSVVPPGAESSSILLKAFGVLRAFNADKRIMSLTELSRESGLPKSTVHRLLARLIELGAVEHRPVGYALSIEFRRLGAITPAAGGRDVALPHLIWLQQATGCAVHFGVLRTLEVVYLEALARIGSPGAWPPVGARVPANCTALGKALLAWQDPDEVEVSLRQNGLVPLTSRSICEVEPLMGQLRAIRGGALAHARDESRPGVSSVAAPIVVGGVAVAAFSISFPSHVAINRHVEGAVRAATSRIVSEFKRGLSNGQARWHPYVFE
jgi:DNA-binding IclR family transcriptional regulator